MAAKKVKSKVTLPPEYTKFTSVFSKEATDHVPPSQPYDHEINLNKSFVPKIYPLSPNEWKATEDFLDENLNLAKSTLPTLPKPPPSFLSKRRMETSIPARTTDTLISVQIHSLSP